MAVNHADIVDGQRHEPKGADAAISGQVYVADGSGSGSWANYPQTMALHTSIADISTASSVYIPLPANCVVNSIRTILGGAITGADATITMTRGGDNLTLGTVTVSYTASAVGDLDSNSSLSNNTLTTSSHKYLKIETDGASSTSAVLYITVTITV